MVRMPSELFVLTASTKFCPFKRLVEHETDIKHPALFPYNLCKYHIQASSTTQTTQAQKEIFFTYYYLLVFL